MTFSRNLDEKGIPSHLRMAIPERETSSRAELIAALADIDYQLELADANENTIERTFKRERLMEREDELRTELDELVFPPKRP